MDQEEKSEFDPASEPVSIGSAVDDLFAKWGRPAAGVVAGAAVALILVFNGGAFAAPAQAFRPTPAPTSSPKPHPTRIVKSVPYEGRLTVSVTIPARTSSITVTK